MSITIPTPIVLRRAIRAFLLLVTFAAVGAASYAGSTHLNHGQGVNFSSAGGSTYQAMTLIDWDAPYGSLIQVETSFGNKRFYVSSTYGSILVYVWYNNIQWSSSRNAWVAASVTVMYDRMDGLGYQTENYYNIALTTTAYVDTNIYVNGSFVSHDDVSGTHGYDVTW